MLKIELKAKTSRHQYWDTTRINFNSLYEIDFDRCLLYTNTEIFLRVGTPVLEHEPPVLRLWRVGDTGLEPILECSDTEWFRVYKTVVEMRGSFQLEDYDRVKEESLEELCHRYGADSLIEWLEQRKGL